MSEAWESDRLWKRERDVLLQCQDVSVRLKQARTTAEIDTEATAEEEAERGVVISMATRVPSGIPTANGTGIAIGRAVHAA